MGDQGHHTGPGGGGAARVDDGPPLRGDVTVFLILAALGAAASFVSLNIPETPLYLDTRMAFGLMGFALLRRWWLALLLALVLSVSGFHTLPLGIVVPTNLLYLLPALAATRVVYGRGLRHVRSLALFGLGWALWVLACYQIIHGPAIAVAYALLDARPVAAAVIDSARVQPFLAESLLVALISTSGLLVLRGRAEIARHRHELAVTLESIGDAVIATDLRGRVTRLNGEAARLTAWDSAEALGRPLSEILTLVNARTGAPVESPVATVLREQRTVDLANHTALIPRVGPVRQIADSAAPIRDTDGRMLGVVMVLRDVTEAYARREALAHRQRQLDLALDAAGMGIWDWDIQSNTLDWLGHQASLFGLRPEDFDGRLESTQALVHPDDWEATIAGALATSRDGAPYDQTFRSVWPDGSVHWLRAVAKLIRDAEGRPWRVIGTTEDITERKAAEERLHATVDALSHSNTELERFAYVASHDLQEPIRSMVAYSQLLGQRYGDRLDDDAQAFLEFIIDGAKRMQALVLDLLEYSRVQAGGLPFTTVDMGGVVRAACDNLANAIRCSAARVEVGALPDVLGDQSQIVSLVQNLIGNAIKFHKPGEPPQVSLSGWRHGAWVTLAVEDQGIGIAPEDRARIFEIFKRLHTRQDYPGTGVGLSIAKRIAERHGGTITVDSQPGEGTRFTVTLPGASDESQGDGFTLT
ncbi:sensor histidine kinase [Roseospira navarrensis]|uniref:histidine kinase n=1 Tax=Roseospira navarrensis TaxID=140058 RepID=A0A7X1ZHR9_9PROT|nr:ATP-binding protein [Roseospira navarrensis]MQX38478.1 PAS domain S-box protein [Roseospira navarrensis]